MKREIYRRVIREDQRGGEVGEREGRERKIMQHNKANIVQTEKQLKNDTGVEGNTARSIRMPSVSALCSLLFFLASKAVSVIHG